MYVYLVINKRSPFPQKFGLKPKIQVFLDLVWHLCQNTRRLVESFRNPYLELKKVLCASSYGHFIAALECWSECRICILLIRGWTNEVKTKNMRLDTLIKMRIEWNSYELISMGKELKYWRNKLGKNKKCAMIRWSKCVLNEIHTSLFRG